MGKRMIIQTLYIDFAGGKYESFFYSDETRYKFMDSYSLEEILCKAEKQEFNKFVKIYDTEIFN